MSTPFQPLEIPAGVVARPTKKMRSSNWAEVNLVRWAEGQLAPIGGQAQFNYTFASPCRKVHSWFDLSGTNHIAYLCEQHIYVDTGGTLTDITPAGGMPAPTYGIGGYSDLTYSLDTYGTARSSSQLLLETRMPDAYSLSNFGAILLAMTSADGRLLAWDPAVGGPMTKASATSPSGRLFVVTEERFVMVFGLVDSGGAGYFYRFGWSDQEDYTNWDFASVASKAGFYDVQPSSPFVTAMAGKYGVLFFTSKQAFVATFSGLPYIYGYKQIADNCTPWSPNSIATNTSQTMWMSRQGLWAFDGSSLIPVPCPVMPWVLDDIDLGIVRETAFMVHVANFNEVWWFFPRAGYGYNVRCVIFNYKEGWWSQGRMTRSAGITSSYNSYVIMADRTVAFQHELGYYYAGAGVPWAETFNLNLSSGSRYVTVKQLVPDIEGAIDSVAYSLFYRNSRTKGVAEVQTPLVYVRPDGFVDFRTTGRDIRMRIQTVGPVVPNFTIGQHQIDMVLRGDR